MSVVPRSFWDVGGSSSTSQQTMLVSCIWHSAGRSSTLGYHCKWHGCTSEHGETLTMWSSSLTFKRYSSRTLSGWCSATLRVQWYLIKNSFSFWRTRRTRREQWHELEVHPYLKAQYSACPSSRLYLPLGPRTSCDLSLLPEQYIQAACCCVWHYNQGKYSQKENNTLIPHQVWLKTWSA